MTVIRAVQDEDSLARVATPGLRKAGRAPIVVSNGMTAQQQRVGLILRLITDGSDQLARQVCDRVDTDRGRRQGDSRDPAPSWTDLARAGRQEGLLSDGEGALLAGCPATLADAQ